MAAKITAVTIFLVMFLLIIFSRIERQYITLACGALMLILVFGVFMQSIYEITQTLNLSCFFTVGFWHTSGRTETLSGINWDTIVFILGMMIMVEGMARTGFFRWLCMFISKLVHYRKLPIFIAFMFMSFVLAMFIDSITVILFLAAVTIELSRLLEFNPVPMILSDIFCANLGGSATMCGDPPNIIIGTSLGYSFSDFIMHTGAMAAISMIAVVIYFYFAFRKEYANNPENTVDISKLPSPSGVITDKKGFIISTIIFITAVVLLVTHAYTGLTVSFIGVFIAVITLITSGKHAPSLLKKVDYKTLLFFIGLFVVVSGLERTGMLEIVAQLIEKASGGNLKLMIAIIIWVSALASAFIDNIPFAATMLPVIRTIAVTQNIKLSVLAWALSMGTDIGGSATPIGASANVVGTSVAAKAGHPIGWGEYCKKNLPPTVITLVISTLYIFVMYM